MGRFLDGVRRGERLDAAARGAGFALSSFYHRRKADPAFDADWQAAMEAAAPRCLDRARHGPGSGQAPAAPRPRPGQARRRPRFAAGRRAAFLEHLATCCDTKAAAAAAGVHVSAVYRRIARDPDFARDNEAALAAGYLALDRGLAEEHEAAAARSRGFEFEPTGRPTSDFDEQMKLLARYTRPAPRRRDRWRPKAMSFEESLAALEVKLSRMDVPPIGDGDSQ